MTRATFFLEVRLRVISSAIVPATTTSATIIRLVIRKYVHILDIVPGHATMTYKIIKQIVHLQVKLEVIV